jgi:hypothetical protein
MKRPTFIGEDEVFLRALIAHTYGKRDFSEDEFFSNRSVVKNHIDSGTALLAQMYQEAGRSGDGLIRRLVDRLLQGGYTLPINPFILPAYDDQTIKVSAREKAESFASINSKLGVVQKGALTEAIRAAYAKGATSAAPYPDFPDVLEIATAAYEADGKKDDSLIEVLRDLSDFDLFWRHGSETAPIDRVSNRTMLIESRELRINQQ